LRAPLKRPCQTHARTLDALASSFSAVAFTLKNFSAFLSIMPNRKRGARLLQGITDDGLFLSLGLTWQGTRKSVNNYFIFI
jgi:hypothetical protein